MEYKPTMKEVVRTTVDVAFYATSKSDLDLACYGLAEARRLQPEGSRNIFLASLLIGLVETRINRNQC